MKSLVFLPLVSIALFLSGCGTTIHRSADGKIKRIEFPSMFTVAGTVGLTRYPEYAPAVVVTPPWTQNADIRQTEQNYGLKSKRGY